MTVHWRFEVVEKTESTNTDLLNRWQSNDLKEPTALLANIQTAGRGRRGNIWVSDDQNSLTFSLAYPFPEGKTIMQIQGLTLACGVTLIQSICKLMNISQTEALQKGLGLKWPNDLLIGNRKLGGILVEGGSKDHGRHIWMIIGIGLNICAASIEMNLQRAHLNELNHQITIHPELFWRELCKDIGDMFELFQDRGFVYFQKYWNEWNLWKGEEVQVIQDGKRVLSGHCLGVNEVGYLLVKTKHGIDQISSGELSLRKLNHE
jgi:BirA family biotin operon repressor/biotin-[acetyl-CoA-carboxylase] ligase